jgi:hypothetical protein
LLLAMPYFLAAFRYYGFHMIWSADIMLLEE